jgi:hypothetical protein
VLSPIDVEEEGGVTTPVDPTMDEDNLQQREKLGRAAGRYSFSLKRSLIPSMSDSPSRKKGGKSGVSSGGANRKGGKSRVSTGSANINEGENLGLPLAKKVGGRQHECRKGDVEPPIIDVVTDTSQQVQTRSRQKNT